MLQYLKTQEVENGEIKLDGGAKQLELMETISTTNTTNTTNNMLTNDN